MVINMRNTSYQGNNSDIDWWINPIELSRLAAKMHRVSSTYRRTLSGKKLNEYCSLGFDNPCGRINAMINMIDSLHEAHRVCCKSELEITVKNDANNDFSMVSANLKNHEKAKLAELTFSNSKFGRYEAFIDELCHFRSAVFEVYENIDEIKRNLEGFGPVNLEDSMCSIRLLDTIRLKFPFLADFSSLHCVCIISEFISCINPTANEVLCYCRDEFEEDLSFQVAKHLNASGYHVGFTSGEYCLDLMATKGDCSIGICCIKSKEKIEVIDIAKAHSGFIFYQCDKVMLYANNDLTPCAAEMAKKLRVDVMQVGKQKSRSRRKSSSTDTI